MPELVKVRTAPLWSIGIRTSVMPVGCRNVGGCSVSEPTRWDRQQGFPDWCQVLAREAASAGRYSSIHPRQGGALTYHVCLRQDDDLPRSNSGCPS